MFLKKMDKFRQKRRSEEGLYQNFDAYGCTIQTRQEMYKNFQLDVVLGNLDEFLFQLPTSPETPPLPANPTPTPERGSLGEYEEEEEDALTDDDGEDGNTDYTSCREAFSETASPFLERRHDHHDHQKVVKEERITTRKRVSTKQNMGNMVALATAKVFLCRAGADDVAHANVVISKPSPTPLPLDIGLPTRFCHVIHGNVDHNSDSIQDLVRQIKGYDMPKWMQGEQWTRNHLNKYAPSLPETMLDRLSLKGGLKVEGIFRINADSKEDDRVRKELDKGELPADVDVHCLAGLIKAWFREFPKGIFDSFSLEQVMSCNSEEDCLKLVASLPQLEKRLLDWVLNLMADVVSQSEYNRMNAGNIATVFAPNFSRNRIEDPLAAYKHVVQVINLVTTLVSVTVRKRGRSETSNLSSFRRRTVG